MAGDFDFLDQPAGATTTPASPANAGDFSFLDDDKAGASPPRQAYSPLQSYLYGAQEMAKGVISSADLPSLASKGINWSLSKTVDPLVEAWMGLKPGAVAEKAAQVQPNISPLFPSPETVDKVIGSPTLNSLQPQNAFDKYYGAANRGAGATLATLPFGGEAALGPQLLAGAGGGIGSQLGGDLAPKTPWASVVGGLIGGLGVGVTGHVISNIADASAASAAVKNAAEAVASAKDAMGTRVESFDAKNAVNDAYDSAVAEHKAAQETAKAALDQAKDSTIDVSQKAIDASKANLDSTIAVAKATAPDPAILTQALADAKAKTAAGVAQVKNGINAIADVHGASQDLDDAGQVLQARAKAFVTPGTGELARREAAAFAPYDALVPSSTPNPIPATMAALEDMKSSGGPFAKVMQTPSVAKLVSAFKQFAPQADESFLEEPGDLAKEPVVPTSADVAKFRSWIGESLADKTILPDIPQQQKQRLYATLTADRRATAEGISPEAASAFDSANAQSKALRDFVDGPIASIIDTPGVSTDPRFSPGTVASRLLSGGRTSGQTLQALRDEPSMSDAVSELASAHLRKVGTNSTAWTGLAPNAREALVTDPAHRQAIDSLIAQESALGEAQKAEEASARASFAAGKQTPEVEAARQAHAETVQQHQSIIDAAKQAHATSLDEVNNSAQQAIADAKFQRDSALRAQTRQALGLQDTLDAAKEQHDKAKAAYLPSGHNLTTFGLEGLVGGSVGEHVADVATHVLGLSGLDPGVSALIGTFAPAVLHGAKALVTPGNIRAAITGANAGRATNPLGASPGQ